MRNLTKQKTVSSCETLAATQQDMKSFLIIIIVHLATIRCMGQNLVPNSSFENYTVCPTSWNLGSPQPDVLNVTGWYSAAQSCEYFNSCANIPTPGIGVPNNATGYQMAFDGTGYSGFGIKFGGNDAEAIGTILSAPLIPNQKYHVSFRVCLSDDSTFATYGINKIGALFTTVKLVYPYNSIFIPAQVYSNQIITDRINWTEISGCFIADSAYKYLNIGHFFTANSTDTTNLYNINYPIYKQLAYYLVDYVNVYKDTLNDCLSSVNETNNLENEILVYPNPSNDFIIIDSKISQDILASIKNIFGIELQRYPIKQQTKIDLRTYVDGIYFLNIEYKNKSFNKKLIVKH